MKKLSFSFAKEKTVMRRILSFIKLDFITVKPYLTARTLFVLFIVPAALSMSNTSASVIIGIVMTLGLVFSSYPFVIGEKSDMDQLYLTLPMSKRTVVFGRYGFVIAFDIISVVVACAFLFTLQTILQREFDFRESLLSATAILMVYTLFQAIQLPIYFKLGYTKAKFLASVPFIIIPIAAVLVGSVFPEDEVARAAGNILSWVSGNQIMTIAVVGVAWLAVMTVSCGISLRVYGKREF